MKHDQKRNKEMLLKALEKSLGIVSAACKDVGLSRDTFYDYYKKDEEFKRKVDELNEFTLDFVESQLMKKIKEGSEKSIQFYMRYKAKKRGYTDSIDITTNGDSITDVNVRIIYPSDKIDNSKENED